MKEKIKQFLSVRRLSLMLVAVLLLAVLTGCAATTPTLGYDSTALQMDTPEEMEAHGLKPSELESIAKLLSAVYATDFDSRTLLVAASRGYDMLAEGFDDSKAEEDKGVKLDYVEKVIKKANDLAAKNSKSEVLSDSDLEKLLGALNEKDVESLVAAFAVKVDMSAASGLDVILSWIGAALNWLTNTLGFGNYVLGICIFAVIVEILMIPFAIKQQKNSIRQATLRPKEMAIKKKYKGRNDQPSMQKMQAEIQEMYQRENFSPFSGCLPLLVQLPIIMALYSIVMDPLHYVLGQASGVSGALTTYAATARAAGGLGISLQSSNGTIELLSNLKNIDLAGISDFAFFTNGDEIYESLGSVVNSLPNFNIGPLNFGLLPSFENWQLLLVPALTFVTYFLTSKLNRKFMYQSAANEGADSRQVACSNSMMDITMPAMSTFFTLAVPALIGVYWAFRSWVGFGKTVIMAKVMPLPTFTEEDYKAAEREMNSKKHVNKKKNEVRAVRSLHHIDDEDFEDTREQGLARRAAIEERERREKEEKERRSKFGAAPLKARNEHKTSEKSEETPETEQQNDNQEEV